MSDVGFTGGGNDSGMLYVDGKQLAKRNNDELIDSIVSEVEKKIKQK
jgi:Enzyme involved in the deoxyxylulose pathway of isoprenoid biosynthesis